MTLALPQAQPPPPQVESRTASCKLRASELVLGQFSDLGFLLCRLRSGTKGSVSYHPAEVTETVA